MVPKLIYPIFMFITFINNKTLPLFIFLFITKSASGNDDCTPTFCSPTGPQIRFPFRLRDRQPARCGFPGFDLTCDSKNQTLIKLASARSYVVNQILYTSQMIKIDPDFCSPGRLGDIKIIGTPFDFSLVDRYTFLNCSTQSLDSSFQTIPMIPFPCLGGVNNSVYAVRTDWIPFGDIPSSCRDIMTVSVPVRRVGDISHELTLLWFRPFCRSCELDGKTCGLKSDDGETVCLGGSSNGIPRGAKYGLSIGIGVPSLVCIFGLVCYIFGRVRNYNQGQRHSIDLFSIAITPQQPTTTGLDAPTIASYPKTILGESCRLPKEDGTCAICLSDYEPKEEVRTIPECNHYFHADCIDEWLKLNATCPVCRNSPETSSLVTPCFSESSNSSNLSDTTT
ncbi:putative RING-H2 finger protein ATL21A [Rutidosis leptorrhynchoides]|uniref:putative RING-H2 finger protein ATL21A n=1 Tax=Rutidosis leptorrhynchoides TaxID=125765 RepID=UPI003A99C746